MNPIIQKIESEQMRKDVPAFATGDTLKVHTRVVESGKERTQIFQGIVISRHGSGINQAFTVRKISSGEGVERVFQVHSPKMARIEVIARGDARRSKLNYLREREGKAATNVRPTRGGWKLKVRDEARTRRSRAKDSAESEVTDSQETTGTEAEAATRTED